ncbi:hypothetical protein B0H13DRAFT_2410652 [Mycena leptocephala]|nr:hypothetical protein B0H13DRAFT_2410652 [Mycena leptocephala]
MPPSNVASPPSLPEEPKKMNDKQGRKKRRRERERTGRGKARGARGGAGGRRVKEREREGEGDTSRWVRAPYEKVVVVVKVEGGAQSARPARPLRRGRTGGGSRHRRRRSEENDGHERAQGCGDFDFTPRHMEAQPPTPYKSAPPRSPPSPQQRLLLLPIWRRKHGQGEQRADAPEGREDAPVLLDDPPAGVVDAQRGGGAGRGLAGGADKHHKNLAAARSGAAAGSPIPIAVLVCVGVFTVAAITRARARSPTTTPRAGRPNPRKHPRLGPQEAGAAGAKEERSVEAALDLNLEVDEQIKAKGVRRHPAFGSGFDDSGFGRGFKDRGSAFDDRGSLFD